MKKNAITLFTGGLLYLILGNTSIHADSLSGTFSTTGYRAETYYVVYVINQAGEFIRTLRVWGVSSKNDSWWTPMEKWDGMYSKNIVDAVTGATASGAGRNLTNQAFSWNGKDLDRKIVPPGSYLLVFESSENADPDDKWRLLEVPFIFDGTAKTVPRTDTNSFKTLKINIYPGTPTLRTIAKSKSPATAITIGKSHFSIPIASKSPISFELYTLNGSRVINQIIASPSEHQNKLSKNVNPGTYLLKASSQKGSIQQKIVIGR